MREFNIFGPVDPKIHYHIDRVAVKSDLRVRIGRPVKPHFFKLKTKKQSTKN
ncbi:MAG: hypothetical protein R3C14_30595 [Caldilineaceae bacterium]